MACTAQEMPKSPLGRTVWGLEETSNDRRAAAGARRRVKLPRNEYRRRVQQGCCTYCGGGDHARTACALGRLMRRVPKQELARRVRDGVCPLCGDWARDGHTKKECSLKKELEGKLGRWTDKGHGDGNNEDDDWNDWVTRPRDAAQETEKASAARVWEWMLRCGGQPAGAPGEETYDADWEAEWEMPETPATPTTNLVELSQGSKETDKAVVVEIVELDEDLLIDLRD